MNIYISNLPLFMMITDRKRKEDLLKLRSKEKCAFIFLCDKPTLNIIQEIFTQTCVKNLKILEFY